MMLNQVSEEDKHHRFNRLVAAVNEKSNCTKQELKKAIYLKYQQKETAKMMLRNLQEEQEQEDQLTLLVKV